MAAKGKCARSCSCLTPCNAPTSPTPAPQLFGCMPHELGPDIRAELESMLRVSVEAVEAAIRWAQRDQQPAGWSFVLSQRAPRLYCLGAAVVLHCC